MFSCSFIVSKCTDTLQVLGNPQECATKAGLDHEVAETKVESAAAGEVEVEIEVDEVVGAGRAILDLCFI